METFSWKSQFLCFLEILINIDIGEIWSHKAIDPFYTLYRLMILCFLWFLSDFEILKLQISNFKYFCSKFELFQYNMIDLDFIFNLDIDMDIQLIKQQILIKIVLYLLGIYQKTVLKPLIIHWKKLEYQSKFFLVKLMIVVEMVYFTVQKSDYNNWI